MDLRRRKLLFRAWHRGLREVDLILGRFADSNIEQLTDAELSEFEGLMDIPDGELAGLADRRGRRAGLPRRPAVSAAARLSDQCGERLTMAKSPAELLEPGRPLTLSGVADGAEGLVVADLARAVAARPKAPATSLVVICRDGPRMAALARALTFFAPDMTVLEFPAWDCLPYDRVSPHAGVVAQRMTALARLARVKGRDRPSILLTTVNAALQRVPARDDGGDAVAVGRARQRARHGGHHPLAGAQRFHARLDRARARRLCGARRHHRPLRAGHAGAGAVRFLRRTLESIRSFDPETQRSTDQLRQLDLVPVSEFQLTTETIRRFRLGYVEAFGAPTPDDLLYEAVSEGRRHAGMEHWLPLFHSGMETIFDYVTGSPVVLEPLDEDAARERLGADQGLPRRPGGGVGCA